MQITVNQPELERFVQEKVRSGEYPSPDAVIEEALSRLQAEQTDGEWTPDELREAVNIGLEQLAQGQAIELEGDRQLDAFFQEIKQAGRASLHANSTEP